MLNESSDEVLLQVQGLMCEKGDRPLFRDVSFRLCRGHLLRIQGANGAGKTTLLRALCGLNAPAAGDVLWCGESISRLREEYGRNLLYIGHAAALKDDLTAVENLMVGAVMAGAPVSRKQAADALGELGLRGREDLPARALSQGQRRRVGLARMLLPSAPVLWVLDEPFTALDGKAVSHLAKIVGAHVSQGGGVVYTTHQEVDVNPERLRVLTLAAGKGELC